jgi:uracil-DNA glycosylase family 4
MALCLTFLGGSIGGAVGGDNGGTMASCRGTVSSDALQTDMRSCTRCLDAGHSVTAGAVFSGTVGAHVMLVGQAPGPTEAVSGIPFCGPSGRRLFRWLADAGWQEDEFRRTQYITAITKCFPLLILPARICG